MPRVYFVTCKRFVTRPYQVPPGDSPPGTFVTQAHCEEWLAEHKVTEPHHVKNGDGNFQRTVILNVLDLGYDPSPATLDAYVEQSVLVRTHAAVGIPDPHAYDN